MDTEGSCESSKLVRSQEGQSEAFVGVCVYQKGVFFKRAFFFSRVFIFMGVKNKTNQNKNRTTYCGILWCYHLSPHPKDVSTCPEDCIERHPSHTEIRKSEALSTKNWHDSAVFLKCALIPSRCSQAFGIHVQNAGASVGVCRPILRRLWHVTGDSRCVDASRCERSPGQSQE